MRLVAAELQHFRRLDSTQVSLDGHVIAIVGPNEAGKSSLLDALARIHRDDAFTERDLTRGTTSADNDRVVTVQFRIEPADRDAIADAIGTSDKPIWFYAARTRTGALQYWIEPRPRRERTPRQRTQASLRSVAETRWGRDLVADDYEGAGTAISDGLVTLAAHLDSDKESLEPEILEAARVLATTLEAQPVPPSAKQLAKKLNKWAEHEARPAPHTAATAILWSRIPSFLKFEDKDRLLASDYELATGIPVDGAMSNLADLAGLDLAGLLADVQRADPGAAETRLVKANAELEKVFADSWRQFNTTVRLDRDGSVVHVLVRTTDDRYSSIAERSDGLRWFVALIAYVSRHTAAAPPPILLIDEAETHLHYEAQADLVRVFDRQIAAAATIYTTHSAGCLPQDLGTGVRLVEPTPGSHTSRIRNDFWTEGSAFLPLLLGMGATALAFTPTRFAVIGEGPSEAILVPTLLRQATGRKDIEFQVAPGLANVQPELVSSLELEAARVAYLVDGDASGTAIRTKLIAEGVPAHLVVTLGGDGSGIVLEDTLKPDIYINAINEELERSGYKQKMPLNGLPDNARPAAVTNWCAKNGCQAPSKTKVAARVLEQRDQPLFSSKHREALRTVHRRLTKALKIPSNPRP